LDYASLEIIFVDGGSTDGTWEIIEENMDVVKVHFPLKANKIKQLNFGLTIAKGEIIVCTDVDGLMKKDALLRMAEAFQDPVVGVVGAWVEPFPVYWLESLYWFFTNLLRQITGHSVVGTCYAFRREVLSSFPDEVIADDIYISQIARKKNLKTVYVREAQVVELRIPTNFKEFWKFRLRRWRAYWKLRDSS
jgi:cellulose synthase/poly-beta-1,6-N-acetylglucosamine synthase-like glycosyltransferase